MPLERINPDTITLPRRYYHVVKDGRTIYIAGQVTAIKTANQWEWAMPERRWNRSLKIFMQP